MKQPRKAVIRGGKIIYDVEAEISKPNEMQARANRQEMKTKHRKNLLQKNETAYYKAYPEQAKNLSDETRRLLS